MPPVPPPPPAGPSAPPPSNRLLPFRGVQRAGAAGPPGGAGEGAPCAPGAPLAPARHASAAPAGEGSVGFGSSGGAQPGAGASSCCSAWRACHASGPAPARQHVGHQCVCLCGLFGLDSTEEACHVFIGAVLTALRASSRSSCCLKPRQQVALIEEAAKPGCHNPPQPHLHGYIHCIHGLALRRGHQDYTLCLFGARTLCTPWHAHIRSPCYLGCMSVPGFVRSGHISSNHIKYNRTRIPLVGSLQGIVYHAGSARKNAHPAVLGWWVPRRCSAWQLHAAASTHVHAMPVVISSCLLIAAVQLRRADYDAQLEAVDPEPP